MVLSVYSCLRGEAIVVTRLLRPSPFDPVLSCVKSVLRAFYKDLTVASDPSPLKESSNTTLERYR